MFRRSFLKNSTLAGLAFTTAAVQSKIPLANSGECSDQPDIEELSITALQKRMKSGELSSVELTRAYLNRIATIDKARPKLNSVIELNPDAIQIASRSDEDRKNGTVRGPLHGIPVMVKDNIDTADKMMTTAGSLALINNIAAKDAHIVKLLRDAGAVVIGKTNLTEWSNFRSSRSVSGWSSRGGQTRNACVLDRNPSGSSAGSAVAVAANLCAVAIGTETNGSIISPASHNGIVGIKPTVGLVSRSGIIPISSTQDTAGALARCVEDAAILLSVLSGSDRSDPVTLHANQNRKQDYTTYLLINGLKGKRVGIDKSFFKGHEGVVGLYKDAISLMKKEGATITEVELDKSYTELKYDQYTLFLYEFKYGIEKYLRGSNAQVKSLNELIEFNKKHELETMPYFKQEIFEQAALKTDLNAAEYLNVINRRKDVTSLIEGIFKKEKLDCICGVTAGLPGAIDMVNGDYDTGFYFGSPAAAAGFPHITVPMGKVHNLPAGLSFVGTAYSEPQLISIAFAYEQASKKREAPRFLATTIPS